MNKRQARKARTLAQRRIYDRQRIDADGMRGISAFVYNLAVAHGATPEQAEAVWTDVSPRPMMTRGEIDHLIRDEILPRIRAFEENA